MMRRFERAGARFVEVPVHHYHRPSGRSQFFRVAAIARSARQLLALWWRPMIRRQEPGLRATVADRAISPPPPRPASARRPV
jgi:hypothetical protein